MTKTFIRTLVLALALLAGTLATAQNTRTLRGKLTEDSGEPLPGAAVVIKGTTRGAVAGDDGRTHRISNSGVAMHPNDEAMGVIASRLYTVISRYRAAHQ